VLPDFIAVKSLAASDLTFIEHFFRTLNVGGQKSINLNADVLTGEFYPNLESFLYPLRQEIRLGLDIYGPAAAGRYPGTRKIIKGGTYKNWRLNGETIHDPDSEPGRFDVMQPGDIAVIGFDGEPAPTAIRMVLLARGAVEDTVLHGAIVPLIPGGRKTMISLSQAQLSAALARPGVPNEHPLALLALDPLAQQALEDAAQGGFAGAQTLRQRRRGRPVTKAELERAKRLADATGIAGEELVNDYLDGLINDGQIPDFTWASADNAISPYDFAILSADGSTLVTRIEVKATTGRFETAFHISFAEIVCAASSEVPYLVYRVFNLTAEGAEISISYDIREFAKVLQEAYNQAMPSGVTADTFSVRVHTPGLTWVAPMHIQFADGEE
jgi:Domain of unknown function (DUF3883)